MSERAQIEQRLHRIADAFSNPGEKRVVQKRYLRYFAGDLPVLDVGCGRGEFLDLLRDAGMEGVGIDHAPGVDPGRHELLCGDATESLAYLAQEGRMFGGALLSHVVEHFSPDRVMVMLDALFAIVPPRGRLVIATPNTKNLVSITEFFWLDPTHVRPYPRALLEAMGRDTGWRVAESYDDAATIPRRSPWKRALASLRSTLSGADRSSPLDSVVVLEKP